MITQNRFSDREIQKHVKLRGRKHVLDIRLTPKYRLRRALHTTEKDIAYQIAMELVRRASKLKGSHYMLSSLFDEFAAAKSDLTLKYLHDMKNAHKLFLGEVNDRRIDTITYKHVTDFRVAMLKRTKKANLGEVAISGYAINGYHRMLHSLFEYALKMKWIYENPFDHFDKTNTPQIVPRAYDVSDYGVYRAKAVEIFGEYFALMLDIYLILGIRDKEGTLIKWKDIDWRKKQLIVPPENTKKDTERIIPLPTYVAEALQQIKARRFKRAIPYHPSTLSHNWLKMRRSCRYNKRTYKGTGIGGTLHGLRRTAVTSLKMIGLDADLHDIMVGHKGKGTSSIKIKSKLLCKIMEVTYTAS